jgi:hypothetical protein
MTHMKPNDRGNRKPISIGNLRASAHTLVAAGGGGGDSPLCIISPKEALGQLIQLEAFTRKYYGRLIVQNWADHPACEIVNAETLQALRAVLGVRTFDAQHLALSPRDPLALLECYVDGSSMDQVEVQPSARGLALVEAILTGEDVSY